MDGPRHDLRLDGTPVTLLGTIAGFVPDAARVETAFQTLHPAAVALGIPPEDLDDLRRLADDPDAGKDMPEVDLHDARLLELLGRFGETRVPSPDLEAAHELAKEAGVPLEAIDLDDHAHSDAYARHVKLRHIVRSNSTRKRILKEPFEDAADAHVLAQAWDDRLNRQAPLQAVEAEREAHMAARLRELAARAGGPVLALVPVARLEGVVGLLADA